MLHDEVQVTEKGPTLPQDLLQRTESMEGPRRPWGSRGLVGGDRSGREAVGTVAAQTQVCNCPPSKCPPCFEPMIQMINELE